MSEILRLKPAFAEARQYEGTLFYDLSVSARWCPDASRYRLARVTLVGWPRRTLLGDPDQRFKPERRSFEFFEFGGLVRKGLDHVEQLVAWRNAGPEGAISMSKRLGNDYRLTLDGLFLSDWRWAPIYKSTESAKLAAVAVYDMLQMEASLPSAHP